MIISKGSLYIAECVIIHISAIRTFSLKYIHCFKVQLSEYIMMNGSSIFNIPYFINFIILPLSIIMCFV